MYSSKRRLGNIIVKNVTVNFGYKTFFQKRMIHHSVAFLQNKLNLSINGLIINFITKDEILKINLKFLNHNYSTDVIVFNYSEANSALDGEIYISVDDALANSKRYKCSAEEEIIRLVTHAILHLVGFDDKEKSEKRKMKKLEDELVIKQQSIWNK